jgi:tripeptidyl-peptidase II
LLVCALKAEKIRFNPWSIKKAVENTSRDIKDPLKVGLILVDESFDYHVKYQSHIDLHACYEITFTGRNNARGLYLREEKDFASRVIEEEVSVDISFKKNDHTLNEDRLNYEQRLVLVCSDPSNYIKHPEFLLMNTGGKFHAFD